MNQTVWGLVLVAALAWGEARAATWLVGPAGVPARLGDVLARAEDGDVIELLPGDYRGEPLVLPRKRLTLRGGGQRPVISPAPQGPQGRALWRVEGGDITVQNIEFRGARSPDADGSGIRLDGGRLTVVDCAFFDNEHGIITGNAADAELVIDRSLFAQAPKVVGGLAHLLYVGRIAKLTVTGSRFHQGFEGHMIKSRARETRIHYNLIHDGPGGESSYEIDLPNGGLATVIGNVIGQSPNSQNPVLVAYGTEERPWPDSRLYLAHNTLVNGRWLPAWFLRVFKDRLPADARVHAINNLTVGLGVFSLGNPGEFIGNASATTGTLYEPAAMSFELEPGSWLRGRGADPRRVGGLDVAPRAEFTMPIGVRPIPPRSGDWTPGAFQR